jgi:hypothetical protein
VSFGRGKEESLSFNRRFFMKDGTVGWNPGKLNPNIIKPTGPIDPDVPVVLFESPTGQPLATYVNFSLHLDTTSKDEDERTSSEARRNHSSYGYRCLNPEENLKSISTKAKCSGTRQETAATGVVGSSAAVCSQPGARTCEVPRHNHWKLRRTRKQFGRTL